MGHHHHSASPISAIYFLFLFPSAYYCDQYLGEFPINPNPNPNGASLSSSPSIPLPTTAPASFNLETNMISIPNFFPNYPYHNLIPRFKIPRGNLSFLANPQWEALYFLKYGQFPVTPNRRRNTTNFLARLDSIRQILEGKSDRAKDILRKVVGGDLGNDGQFSYPEGTTTSTNALDPGSFFTFHGPLGAYIPTVEEAQRMLQEYEREFGVIAKETLTGNENEENNFLDNLALQLKSSSKSSSSSSEGDTNNKQNEAAAADLAYKNKRDGMMKYFMEPRGQNVNNKEETKLEADAVSVWRKFLLENDPTWIRQRMKINLGPRATLAKVAKLKQNQLFHDEQQKLGRNWETGGNGIMSRSESMSGGGSFRGSSGLDDSGGGTQDGTRPGRPRKFQTQGWK
jgi:hypothetical protein